MELLSKKNRILLNLFKPQRRTPDREHAIPRSDKDLSQKTIVFTGGTDGIGRVAVEMLHQMGATVVLLGRTEAKADAVIRDLNATGGKGTVLFEKCDLASMASVKECASRVLAAHPRIDVLVNNAGVNSVSRTITDDGFEISWSVNYLAPYLLTNLLLDRLKESAPARIVNTTTNVEFLERYYIEKIVEKPALDSREPYVESKLALTMYTIDLASQLAGTGVTVNCLHPGNIKSNLLREMNEGSAARMAQLMQLMASPTEVGADRIVRLSISSEYDSVTGEYVLEDDISPQHPEALDAAKRDIVAQMSRDRLSEWL